MFSYFYIKLLKENQELKNKRFVNSYKIAKDCLKHWNDELYEIEEDPSALPEIKDNNGKRYVISKIGPNFAIMHDSYSTGWDSSTEYNFNIEYLMENFSDSLYFENLIEDLKTIVDKSEYDRLKQIEDLHYKSINELNDVLKVNN